MATEAPASPKSRVVQQIQEFEINKLFRMVMKHEGSDLHLKVGIPPMMRLAGTLRQMQLPLVTEDQMEKLTLPIITDVQAETLADTGGVDFAHVIGDEEGRFRVNLFRQRGRLSLVARSVKTEIPDFEELHLPGIVEDLSKFTQGMVLLAGVTGRDRKSTRLNSSHTDISRMPSSA